MGTMVFIFKKSPFPIPLEMMPWSSQRAELLLSLAKDFLLPDTFKELGHEQCEDVCAVCPALPAASEFGSQKAPGEAAQAFP